LEIKDGTIVKVFSWKFKEANDAAHSNLIITKYGKILQQFVNTFP